jgi:NADPH:quinone reductase-like Zn-dependent oxidoreductase
MKTIQLQDGFGIDRLQQLEQSHLTPTSKEVLVKLEAVSLNYVDLLVVRGSKNKFGTILRRFSDRQNC